MFLIITTWVDSLKPSALAAKPGFIKLDCIYCSDSTNLYTIFIIPDLIAELLSTFISREKLFCFIVLYLTFTMS